MKNNKVYLRPIEKNDLSYLNKWKNNSELFKYLGGGYRPTSVLEQESWLTDMSKMGSNQRFMICDNNQMPIGMIGLYSVNLINRNCEIGMYIGDEESRGKGYAQESLKMIEDYARNFLNIKKLKIYVVKSNTVAINFWKKNNYCYKGELSQERYIEGNYHDVLIMEKFITVGDL